MEEIHINNKHRVSIGLPVYNGENYIEKALDSILAQTFADFELIISDNASTDRTSGICQAYAAKDKRIRYYRIEKNQGAAWNFNRVFELSTGEYFKWAAHDDLIAPDYISKCLKVLDNDESIILCNSKVKFIDKLGDVIEDHKIELKNVNSPNPQDRFGELIYLDHWCFNVFGLIRSDSLKKTSLIKAYPGSDRALLVELGLLGRFHEIPEYLFFNRDHTERSTKAYPDIHFRTGWFDTSKEGQISLPQWIIFFEYFKSINNFPQGLFSRLCCYRHLGNWMVLYHRGLVKELIMIINHYSSSILRLRKNKQ